MVKTEDLDFDLKQEPEEEKKSNQVRGHVHMTSTNLRDFWTPSVSLCPHLATDILYHAIDTTSTMGFLIRCGQSFCWQYHVNCVLL